MPSDDKTQGLGGALRPPRPLRYPAVAWQRPGRLPRRFDGAGLRILLGFLATVVVISAIGWISLPRVVTGWVNLNRYQALIAQRERLGRRYGSQVGGLSALQRRIATGLETTVGLRQLLGLPRPAGVRVGAAAESSIPGSSIYADLGSARVRSERAVRVSLGQWERELVAVEEAVEGERSLAMVPTVLPVAGDRLALSSDFGRHMDPLTEVTRFHNGMLIATPQGTQLIAPADGRVAFTGIFRSTRSTWQRLGRMVVLRHGDDFITILGHTGRSLVSRGQSVERGDPVAEAGDSGMVPHPGVYYEVRQQMPGREAGFAWVPVDPKFYILDHSWGDDLQRRSSGRPERAPEYEPLPLALRR